MKRLLLLPALVVALVLPAGAFGFHHGSIPAGACAESTMAGTNPIARVAIRDRNPVKTPGPTFPPFLTPGAFQGQGDEHCANA